MLQVRKFLPMNKFKNDELSWYMNKCSTVKPKWQLGSKKLDHRFFERHCSFENLEWCKIDRDMRILVYGILFTSCYLILSKKI